jgi:cob(I)alamin adenosyltransferase
MAAQGLVIVLTGEGKGKTTSALGIAMRAVGRGLRVLMVQFLKGSMPTGEIVVARRLEPELELRQFGAGFVLPETGPTERDIALAREGLTYARKAMAEGRCDLLILDEVNNAIKAGLLPLAEVAEVVTSRPPKIHVVLTGRDAPQGILNLADTVTEMRAIRHHYASGRTAVPGIEW